METEVHYISKDPKWTSATKEPSVTIAICTRYRAAWLRNCLHAISQLNHLPDELIVIDNTSGDKETEVIAREYGARYIIEPKPGLSRARNRGLSESSSEIVAYLDDDAIPEEGWLDALRQPFADPTVGIVTGETVSSIAERPQEGTPTRFLTNQDQQWFEIAAYGGLGIGTNMALRRERCLGWKVFDERLGRRSPARRYGRAPCFRGSCGPRPKSSVFARCRCRSYVTTSNRRRT